MEKIGTIVILHGYGADGADMEFLEQAWQHPAWNIQRPDGYIDLDPGYAWFDLYSDNWLDGIRESAKKLEEKFMNYAGRLIFAGFSQGAFLAAYMGLYSKLKIDGCICFSGGILPLERTPKQTPMFLVHGDADEVIIKNWYEQSMQFAQENNLPIDGKLIHNLNHTINDEALAVATENLLKIRDITR